MENIDKKIISVSIKDTSEFKEEPVETIETLLTRPETLAGFTYKVKTPTTDHALYITINDAIVNDKRVPYEIFISSKETDHFQWVVALTRVISAIFRKGGDVTFLVEELKSIFDPRGGYYKKGGVFMPSLVAEIGSVIYKHMLSIGAIEKEDLSKEQLEHVAKKKIEAGMSEDSDDFPPEATVCKKCNVRSVVILDNCATCLSCSDSKCG